MQTTNQYLELLKKTLTFSLWEDPGKPIQMVAYRAGMLAPVIAWVAKLMERFRLRLVVLPTPGAEHGTYWHSWAHTMVGRPRLDNAAECVRTVIEENIPGEILEAGVWRGGTSMLMKAAMNAYGDKTRILFVCDSFAGLPEPDQRYPEDSGDQHHAHNDWLAVSKWEVMHNFTKYGLLDDRVRFIKGWFKDTLQGFPYPLAIMRLDGDMYESTWDGLTNLYPKLSPGGFCIIDDYALEGCKKAVDKYRALHNITAPLVKIDYSGAYWRKPNGLKRSEA
jgi:O-methyltransferase